MRVPMRRGGRTVLRSILPVTLLGGACVSPLRAQRATLHPGAPPETRQFEFMLGDWHGSITSRDSIGRETSVEIFWTGTYILDGWAIRTDWRIPLSSGAANHGSMLRAYDARQRRWHVAEFYTPGLELRTFTARVAGSEMIQLGETETASGRVMSRRTFFNITPDQYENRYEVSSDGGRTWREQSRSVVRRIR